MNNTSISNALKRIVDSYWQENKEPILLSNLPSILEKEIVDFRDGMKGSSLKSFIKDSADSYGYCLIEHPVQKAKVGIIPSGEDYSFPEESESNKTVAKKKLTQSKGNPAVNLLEILSELSKDDLEKVNIPLSVIVKLFK